MTWWVADGRQMEAFGRNWLMASQRHGGLHSCNNNRMAVSGVEMEISYRSYLKEVWTLRDLEWTYENDAFDVLWVVRLHGHFEQLDCLFADRERRFDFRTTAADTFKQHLFQPIRRGTPSSQKDAVNALGFCPLHHRSKAAFIVLLT